jgi:hypothetical protein
MFGRWRRVKPQQTPIQRIMAPLKENMPKAGDFSFEGIKGLGHPVPMHVQNDGDALLELWLEPFGQDYWLLPGEAVTVTSYGHSADRVFETIHEPNRITVWATSWFATVSDDSGNEIPGAHRRPPGAYE